MSTFSMFRTAWDKKPEAKQITWVCGSEPVLVEDVVSTIRDSLNLKPWSYSTLVAGEDSERTIWAEAEQYPVDKTVRLIVIRNAEKLKNTERMQAWIKNRNLNPLTYLIFVSNDPRLPRLEPTEEQKRKNSPGDLAPHVAAIQNKGPVIECRPFTQATAKHAVTWVRKKVPMREGIAGYLLERANGDLRLVRDICAKLAVFPDEVTLTTINGMLSERPRDTFADALLALDKKTALLALQKLPVAEYGRTIGLLDSKLDLAGMVHDMLVQHKTPADIARAAGNKNFLVKDIIPVSKHYSPARRLAIRQTLAMADEYLQMGLTKGPLEAIIAFW